MDFTGNKCPHTKMVQQKILLVGLLLCDRHHLFIWIQQGIWKHRECKHKPCQFKSSASILSVRLCIILRQIAVLPTKLFWDHGTHNRACMLCLLQNQSRLNSMLKLTKVSLLIWNAYEPMQACVYGGVYNGRFVHMGCVCILIGECSSVKFPWQWNIVFCAELQCARRYDTKLVLSLRLFCLIQPFFWLNFTLWTYVLSSSLRTTC